MTALDRLADRLTGGALTRARDNYRHADADRRLAATAAAHHDRRAEKAERALRAVHAALTRRGHLVQDGETVATAVARALDGAQATEGQTTPDARAATVLLGAVLSRFRRDGDGLTSAIVGRTVLDEWHRRYAALAVGAGHPAAAPEPDSGADVPFLRGAAYLETVRVLAGWLHDSRLGELHEPTWLTDLVRVLGQHIPDGSVGAPTENAEAPAELPGPYGDLSADEERVVALERRQAAAELAAAEAPVVVDLPSGGSVLISPDEAKRVGGEVLDALNAGSPEAVTDDGRPFSKGGRL